MEAEQDRPSKIRSSSRDRATRRRNHIAKDLYKRREFRQKRITPDTAYSRSQRRRKDWVVDIMNRIEENLDEEKGSDYEGI